jgi:hypothetical protein
VKYKEVHVFRRAGDAGVADRVSTNGSTPHSLSAVAG